VTDANLPSVTAEVAAEPAHAGPRPLVLPQAGALEATARRALDAVIARLALAWRDGLTARFRTLVDLEPQAPEELVTSRALAAMPAPRAAFRLALEPRRAGAAWFDLDAAFGLALVERLFGGPGNAGEPRALTPIEQSALRAFVEPMVARVAEAWKEPRALGLTTVAFANDPASEDDVAAGRLLRLAFEVRIGDTAGTFALLLPFEAARDALTVSAPAGAPAPGTASPAGQLARAALTLSARLPVAWLGAGRVAALAPGTLLPLGLAPDAPVDVEANGRRLFEGAVGQHDHRIAVRITRTRTAADDTPSPRLAPGRNA
jgi:flagellar motor switch protein FliM